jgi:hypothetical protein
LYLAHKSCAFSHEMETNVRDDGAIFSKYVKKQSIDV